MSAVGFQSPKGRANQRSIEEVSARNGSEKKKENHASIEIVWVPPKVPKCTPWVG